MQAFLTRLFRFCQSQTPAMFSMLAFLFAVSGHRVSAEQKLDALLKKVPGSANAIIAIDADRLRNSPLGKQKNWTATNEAAYTKSPFLLPPESNLVVIGSHMNPNQDFAQTWELAVMSLTEPMTPRTIARAEGGEIDEVAGVQAVYSPNDAYFISFANDLLAVMSPADRQSVANWIRSTEANQNSHLSTYLVDAANQLLGDSQIVLAVDLQNAVMPHQLKSGLAEAEFLKGKDNELAAWQSVIETLQGTSLTVQVTDQISGKLHIDFGADPKPLGKLAKDAIISVLEKHGVAFDSIETWTLSQSGNQLQLAGELSETDLRQILSLLESPSSHFDLLDGQEVAADNDREKVANTSKKYFDSVTSLLKDMEDQFRRDGQSMSRAYIQRYAKRVNALPILNVDTDLVSYGLKVAETLRNLTVIQGRANVSQGVRTSSVYGYGYYDVGNASAVKNQMAREEQAGAVNARFDSWKAIQDATAQLRVDLTNRYGIEF